MRGSLVVSLTPPAVLLFALACAPRARTVANEPGPGASAGYVCAYRQLQQLGYSIARAAPEAGAIRGERIVSPPLREPTVLDELVVAAPRGPNATGPVRVTARGAALEGTRRTSVAPTTRGRADASRIAERCAERQP